MTTQFIVIFLVVTFVGAAGYGAVHTYNSAIEEKEQAVAQGKLLEEANLNLALAAQAKDFDLQMSENSRKVLEDKFDESRQEVQKLEGLFREHNFNNLYDKKPGLILKRVNAGTDRVLRELETLVNSKKSGKNKGGVPEAS